MRPGFGQARLFFFLGEGWAFRDGQGCVGGIVGREGMGSWRSGLAGTYAVYAKVCMYTVSSHCWVEEGWRKGRCS